MNQEPIELNDGSVWTPIPTPAPDESRFDYTRAAAQALLRSLRPYFGKRVMLFGGGSSAGNFWFGRLIGAKIEPGRKTARRTVRARLSFPTKRAAPIGDRNFNPILASWWIAVRR